MRHSGDAARREAGSRRARSRSPVVRLREPVFAQHGSGNHDARRKDTSQDALGSCDDNELAQPAALNDATTDESRFRALFHTAESSTLSTTPLRSDRQPLTDLP